MVSNNKEKSETESWNENVSLKFKLEKLACTVTGKIVFPNYNNFIELSEASIGNQLTMISVLSIFWKIFNSTTKDDDNDAIGLLESILMDQDQEENLAIQSIKKFLKQSSIDMRLNLWNILLLFTSWVISTKKLQLVFKNVYRFSIGTWRMTTMS